MTDSEGIQAPGVPDDAEREHIDQPADDRSGESDDTPSTYGSRRGAEGAPATPEDHREE